MKKKECWYFNKDKLDVKILVPPKMHTRRTSTAKTGPTHRADYPCTNSFRKLHRPLDERGTVTAASIAYSYPGTHAGSFYNEIFFGVFFGLVAIQCCPCAHVSK